MRLTLTRTDQVTWVLHPPTSNAPEVHLAEGNECTLRLEAEREPAGADSPECQLRLMLSGLRLEPSRFRADHESSSGHLAVDD